MIGSIFYEPPWFLIILIHVRHIYFVNYKVLFTFM